MSIPSVATEMRPKKKFITKPLNTLQFTQLSVKIYVALSCNKLVPDF